MFIVQNNKLRKWKEGSEQFKTQREIQQKDKRRHIDSKM